ncbi:NmrA family NAD(P)-binding protein [Pseudomonas cedrina subsp. fulgida]|nr:NmrA family NAD(P)-binding protein [Pseudomonas cedrina subsp. fulgida]
MYTIMGVTGQVGGEVARVLLAAGEQVRVVVRDVEKGASWAAQGCDVAVADLNDVHSLIEAFKQSHGVFVLLPPNFDPVEGFPQTREFISNLHKALLVTRPAKVVCLSTIGAQATQPNLLTQLQLLEHSLRSLETPISFLRPAWYMENHQWDIDAARSGMIPSFLQPLDKPVPMIATVDVGRTAAELIRETWQGKRVVELEATDTITPFSIAQTFAELLGHPVSIEAVPRDTWEDLFRKQGMNNPLPRVQMLDGFNAEWICFEGVPRTGRTPLKEVLGQLIKR